MTAAMMAGNHQICAEKKRASVTALRSVPPRSTWLMNGPIQGTVSAMEVPTVVAQ